MDGPVLDWKIFFEDSEILFLSWIRALKIISVDETAYKKIGAFSRSMKFLCSEFGFYLYKSIIWCYME